MNIIQSLDDLESYRISTIADILSEFLLKKGTVEIVPFSLDRKYIIGISNTRQKGTNYREWRFNTINENIQGCYYEIWIPFDRDQYYMDKSYLHLYNMKEGYIQVKEDREYLLLHSDPNEPECAPHSKYKRSPHLHFEFAAYPINKSHVALNNCDLTTTLSSLANFDNSFKTAVEMITEEFLINV